jgi:iron complex transport system substrate-binding protein
MAAAYSCTDEKLMSETNDADVSGRDLEQSCWRSRGTYLFCLATALLQLAAIGPAHADVESPQAVSMPGPMRIVSLNPCLDAILVELVPLQRIAAISHYSRDTVRSSIAPLAQRLPITYETAEEIVALRPDLVLASKHSAIPTRNALRRVGIRYELFDVAFSVADSIKQIRRIAALVGRPQQGEALAARIERAVEAARAPDDAPRLTAAMYETGGLTAGANTVTNELMQIVGLDNLAARYDIQQHRPLPLELLVAAPPDLLLVGEIPVSAATQAARIMHHRALRRLPSTRQSFPAPFMYCSGPRIVEQVSALVAARDNALADRRRRSPQ